MMLVRAVIVHGLVSSMTMLEPPYLVPQPEFRMVQLYKAHLSISKLSKKLSRPDPIEISFLFYLNFKCKTPIVFYLAVREE
jgi:hypothetical protein